MKAYPFQHRHPTTGVTTSSEGMDLRDYFAGLAMVAYIQVNYDKETENGVNWNNEDIAIFSYWAANAMLRARDDDESKGA
jgi:hypothetical protein